MLHITQFKRRTYHRPITQYVMFVINVRNINALVKGTCDKTFEVPNKISRTIKKIYENE
jgi:hypothetical protein